MRFTTRGLWRNTTRIFWHHCRNSVAGRGTMVWGNGNFFSLLWLADAGAVFASQDGCFSELGFSWHFDHLWQCEKIPMNVNYSFWVLFNPVFSCVQESSTYFPLSWRFEESKLFRWSTPATAQVCCRGDNKSKQETAGRDLLLSIKSLSHRKAELCNRGPIPGFILNSCFQKPQWGCDFPYLIFS